MQILSCLFSRKGKRPLKFFLSSKVSNRYSFWLSIVATLFLTFCFLPVHSLCQRLAVSTSFLLLSLLSPLSPLSILHCLIQAAASQSIRLYVTALVSLSTLIDTLLVLLSNYACSFLSSLGIRSSFPWAHNMLVYLSPV